MPTVLTVTAEKDLGLLKDVTQFICLFDGLEFWITHEKQRYFYVLYYNGVLGGGCFIVILS